MGKMEDTENSIAQLAHDPRFPQAHRAGNAFVTSLQPMDTVFLDCSR